MLTLTIFVLSIGYMHTIKRINADYLLTLFIHRVAGIHCTGSGGRQ